MTNSMGMTDFFTMEATDYLERLDGLVSPASAPDDRELLRLSRALRGSAIMAGQQPIADAASGLEHLARAVTESRVEWSEGTRQLAIRAVDDLKVLVRSVSSWGSGEDARASQITAELMQVAGRTDRPQKPQTEELDAGTRAFIAREGAAVGSALDRAARALTLDPRATDALTSVTRSMQPLRGIACLSDLPPFPDLLDGIERAVQEVAGHPGGIDGAADLFDAAAKAVSRAAREIASSGEINEESEESTGFAARLGDLLRKEEEAETRAPTSAASTAPPSGEPSQLSRLELVSHAEHLTKFAADLEGAESGWQRAIRAHALGPILRSLASGGGDPHADAAAAFARAARNAAIRGAAVNASSAFAEQLRAAGSVLADAGQGGRDPSADLAPIIEALESLGTVEEATADVAAPAETEVVVDAAMTPPESEPIVVEPDADRPAREWQSPPDPVEHAESAPGHEPAAVSSGGFELVEEPPPAEREVDDPFASFAAPAVPSEPAEPDDEMAIPEIAAFAPAEPVDSTPPPAWSDPPVEDAASDASLFAAPETAPPESGPETVEEPVGHAGSLDDAGVDPDSELFDPEGNGDELAAAFATLMDLETEFGLGPGTLSELLGESEPAADEATPIAQPEPTPVPEVTPAPEAVPVATRSGIDEWLEAEPEEAEAQPEDPTAGIVVPITDFCYEGRDALQRALTLREQIRDAAARHESPETLAALIEEVFDLVELGIERPS